MTVGQLISGGPAAKAAKRKLLVSAMPVTCFQCCTAVGGSAACCKHALPLEPCNLVFAMVNVTAYAETLRSRLGGPCKLGAIVPHTLWQASCGGHAQQHYRPDP